MLWSLAFFLWSFILEVTCKIYHEFFFFYKVLVYRPVYLLEIIHKMSKKLDF